VLIDKNIGGRGSCKLLVLLGLSRKVVKTLSLAANFGCFALLSGQLCPTWRYVGRDRRRAMNSTGGIDRAVFDVILSRTFISVENSQK